jgi:hypothetical protein
MKIDNFNCTIEKIANIEKCREKFYLDLEGIPCKGETRYMPPSVILPLPISESLSNLTQRIDDIISTFDNPEILVSDDSFGFVFGKPTISVSFHKEEVNLDRLYICVDEIKIREIKQRGFPILYDEKRRSYEDYHNALKIAKIFGDKLLENYLVM